MKPNSIRLRVFAGAALAACAPFVMAAPSSTSAYMTDVQHSFVQDQTSDGINQVNTITCFMGAMKPDSMVNAGDYVALVDESKCDTSSRDKASNSTSSNSGSSASQYITATLNSTRTSSSAPMTVKTWVDETALTIYVYTTASVAPSDTNPYGEFRMDFCGNASGSCMFNGFLEAATSGLSYYETGSMGGGSRIVALSLSANGTTAGSGRMSLNETSGFGSTSSDFTFAYNPTYFLRSDGSASQCFSRDAQDAGTGFSVWRYGLYDADSGARITRNSGFPIEHTSSGTTHHGYMGYWGLWLPQDVLSTVASGDTLSKVDYSSGTPVSTPYTLVKAGGKLTKHTKQSKTLASLDKIRFSTFTFAPVATLSANQNYEMYWDETNKQFVAAGVQTCGSSGCNLVPLTPNVNLSIAALKAAGYSFGLNGWSQSLGGEVFIDMQTLSNDGSNSASTAPYLVRYRNENVVYPSEYASLGSLYCITDCPTPSGIASSDPFGSTAGNFTPTATLVPYTLNATTGNMESGGTAVTTSGTLTGQFEWGIRSGRLFPANITTTNDGPGIVDAADGTADGTYTSFAVDSLNVYYIWETGPNAWNQFAAVKDGSGTYVTFDAPLSVNYTVPSGAAYGNYASTTIVLEYNGFGDLFGIPGKCVLPATNEETSCGTSAARYVPEFAIPFDQTTGAASSGTTNYLVKWLEREIRLAKKDTSVCSAAGLSLPSTLPTLPTSASLKNPSSSASDVYIGSKPVVTAAPRVIHGVVQY